MRQSVRAELRSDLRRWRRAELGLLQSRGVDVDLVVAGLVRAHPVAQTARHRGHHAVDRDRLSRGGGSALGVLRRKHEHALRHWRGTSATTLTIDLTRIISFRISHAFEYRNTPVGGFERTDMRTSAALVLSWQRQPPLP